MLDKAAVLHIDFETFATVDLKKTGAHIYAAHPDTRVLCAAWAMNDDEPKLWLPGDPCPVELAEHITFGGEVAAWNAQFERLIFKHVMGRLYGWPIPLLQQFRCIMVQALAMALPGSLGKAGPAAGLPVRKDEKGSRVMLQLCKPRHPTKTMPLPYFTPKSHPAKFSNLYAYCLQDVRVEQAIDKRTLRLRPTEQDLYWRDQAINDRGVPIDMNLVEAAQAVVDQALPKLDAEMRDVTDNEVASCSAVAQIKVWLNAGGCPCDSLDKEHVIKLLRRDDLTNSQRIALSLRQEAAKSSTAKLSSFATHVSTDGRVRGTLQFNGAWTGRDAARGVQVQNFPRPNKKTDVNAAIADILKYRDAVWIESIHGPAMSIVSDCLRGVLYAASGKEFISRDLSQIEARLTSYLAGEDAIVDAYRAYDRKEGPDIYTVAAAGIYNVAPHTIGKDDPERQVGKVSTLALGFGGGAGAFGSMAKIYSVDLVPLFPIVWEMADGEEQERCRDGWAARGRSSGMRKEAWCAAEIVKLKWRAANPATVQHWKDLEGAAIDALLQPGTTTRAGDIRYRHPAGSSFLKCILPSGRSIFYPYPRLVEEQTPWGKMRTAFRFSGVDGYTKQWREFAAYGGMLHQNSVQSVARDVMFEAMVRCEDAGYPNVARVHDELISEVATGFGSEEEYHSLVVQPPTWAKTLPIAADGWRRKRYGK